MAADIRKIYVYDDFSSSEPLLAGCLYITPIRGGESCAFEYDEEWLKKMSPAVSLDPELMPFPGRQYLTDGNILQKHVAFPEGR